MSKKHIKVLKDAKTIKGKDIGLPLFKKLLKKRFQKQTEGSKEIQEPIGIVIFPDGNVEIWENVSVGKIAVERDGKKVPIVLPRQKLLTFKWGNSILRGFIIDVNRAVALPSDDTLDSLVIKNVFDNVLDARQKYEASQKIAQGKYFMYVAIAVVIVIAGMSYFNGWEQLGKVINPSPSNTTIDNNITQPVSSIDINNTEPLNKANIPSENKIVKPSK